MNEKKKTVIAFSVSSFLNDLGMDMIRPYWPLFVTSFLGAPMAFLGLLDGLGDMISYSIRFPAGYLSDRFKNRKILIWAGYLFAALSRVGYAFTTLFYFLIPFKVLDRLGKLRDPPRDAMLSLTVNKTERGKVFGFLNAADQLGGAFGPLIGLLLFWVLGFQKLFLVAAIPSLIAVFVIFFFVKERKYVKLNNHFHFNIKELNVNLKRLIFVGALFGLSWFSVSFMVIYVSKYLSLSLVPFLFIIMGVIAALTSAFVGRLSDFFGRKYFLALGYLLFSFVCLGFLFFDVKHYLIFSFGLFILYGIHYGCVTGLHSAFVSDLCKKEVRGSAIGLFQTVLGFCMLPASLIAGFLWDNVSVNATFVYGLIMSFVSTLLLILLVKKG